MGTEINRLIEKLKTADTKSAKAIRTRLRALGHRGGTKSIVVSSPEPTDLSVTDTALDALAGAWGRTEAKTFIPSAPTMAKIVETKTIVPSPHQAAFYDWIQTGTGHGMLEAVAGSGKTTTIVEATRRIKSSNRVAICCFARVNAEDLQRRNLPRNVTACTVHSLMSKVLRSTFSPCLRVDKKKTDNMLRAVLGDGCYGCELADDGWREYRIFANGIKRVVSLLKNFGFGVLRAEPTREETIQLCDRYGLDVVETDGMSGDVANARHERFFDLLFRIYMPSIKDRTVIDYDDMLLIPLADQLNIPTFDFVFIDECQDLNSIQIEIAKRMVRKGGRAIFVGDRHQAIYGFRGADVEAVKTIEREFNVTSLPLSICWRCPRAVIELAKEIVPHIEPAPNAIEGTISSIEDKQLVARAQSGDYVLCRLTAPLVGQCLDVISTGRKAMVRGRDMAEGLMKQLDAIDKSTNSNLPLCERLENFFRNELQKLTKPSHEDKRIKLEDRCETLMVLAEGCTSIQCVKDKIDRIFSDTDAGVVFSTVHRAKGLETARVFILKPELMPFPRAKEEWQIEQEMNLKYVAMTRSMSELIWVETTEKKD